MSKEIFISSTPHETRLAIVENDALTEIYYERENEYTLAGSIYNGKVTRVLPGMQSSFVDIGLERDAFLYITDFMEEAGDAADFEGTANGNRAPRTDRPEGRTEGRSDARSEGRNRDRGDRSGNRELTSGSPETTAPPTLEAAPESGSRERSGRGGRGRRDRNFNRDRQPTTPAPAFSEGAETIQSDFSHPIPPPTPAAEGADLGEGAPGADGSRRWRGRRGRRRGRGPREEGTPIAGTDTQPGLSGDDSTYTEPAFSSDDDAEENFNFDGAAAATPPARPAAPTGPVADAYNAAPAESTGRADRNARNDRGGRGRGDRGGRERNDRDGNDRGGSRDQRPPRVPRGFAPRGFAPQTSLYGVDSSADAAAPDTTDAGNSYAALVQPILLPGESLSKYRKGGEEAAAPKAPESTIVLPVASSYAIPEGWDGGSVLPGETIRPRRPEAASDSRSDSRDSRRSEGRNEGRSSRGDRSDRSRREPSAEHRPDTTASFRNTPAPVVLPEAPAPVAPVDYEPTEASASYRVDPIAPSEFRQAAPVLEPEAIAAEPVVEEVSTPTHTITPAPSEPVAAVHTDAQPRWDWQSTSIEPVPVPLHDVTTLTPTGELVSETPVLEPAAAPIHHEQPEPTSPILHETAIANPAEVEIEEEMTEDEDVALNASSIEEMDDFEEEETLEGAADLGTMLREMSIDQITRSSADPEEDADDFDMEEEDSVHDFTTDDPQDSDEGESSDEGDSFSEDSDEAFTSEESGSQAQNGEATQPTAFTSANPERNREGGDRARGRSDSGRRDGRRRDGRSDRDRGDRPRNTGGSGDRERSGIRREGRSGGRQSMQSTNLPAISDLLKPGQEVLVQIAKEPIAKKGARITSHIALPGRFLVFMPTVSHTGVSRKIESDSERRRLKEILLSEKGDASGGFIVRTAASGASEEELRSDLRFLLNLWTDIKTRSESSKSPALIYHDLNLVERILRDQVTDNFSAIWVDTETDYERILRFLQRFQPSLIRRVKLYTKETPLFEQFGITEEINKALRSKVWLKSGGSIVINQTEALVAIDINTGKFVGKTAHLEDTIVKTNLDAIPEIVRQIRLRDLGGIIIIDFIDMDERKNRNKVMAALEDELKSDRAPSKVLPFNDFGLVAITRKRVKQSLERTLSTTCNVCVGTGMVKSPITVCNDIYIEMRKMHKHLDRGDVMLRVHPEVVKALKSTTSRWLQEMEEMVGRTILVKSDPSLHPEQFDIH